MEAGFCSIDWNGGSSRDDVFCGLSGLYFPFQRLSLLMAASLSETNPYLRQKQNRMLRNAVVRHSVIIFFLLTILLPLTWVLMLSIKSLPDSMRGNLWPRRFDFSHYGYVFDKIETLPHNLFNSIYVTGATVLITTFCAVLAGYALVHLKPRGGPFIVAIFLSLCTFQHEWFRSSPFMKSKIIWD